MSSPDDTEWRKAYEASLDREERTDELARQRDPGSRTLEVVGRLRVATFLGMVVAMSVGLAITGPWYLSVIGVMLLSGAVVAAAVAVVERLRKS